MTDPARIARAAIGESLDYLSLMCREDDASLSDYACTVVALGVRSDGHWVSIHLGDGGIVEFDGTAIKLLLAPQKGEFANVTFFATDRDAASHIACTSSTARGNSTATGFLLFTDGLEVSLVNRHTGEVASAARRMIEWLTTNDQETVTQALSMNIKELFQEKTHDDCTAIVIARSNA